MLSRFSFASMSADVIGRQMDTRVEAFAVCIHPRYQTVLPGPAHTAFPRNARVDYLGVRMNQGQQMRRIAAPERAPVQEPLFPDTPESSAKSNMSECDSSISDMSVSRRSKQLQELFQLRKRKRAQANRAPHSKRDEDILQRARLLGSVCRYRDALPDIDAVQVRDTSSRDFSSLMYTQRDARCSFKNGARRELYMRNNQVCVCGIRFPNCRLSYHFPRV